MLVNGTIGSALIASSGTGSVYLLGVNTSVVVDLAGVSSVYLRNANRKFAYLQCNTCSMMLQLPCCCCLQLLLATVTLLHVGTAAKKVGIMPAASDSACTHGIIGTGDIVVKKHQLCLSLHLS